MYTVFLFLAILLAILAIVCCFAYTIIQCLAWVKATELSKRDWPVAIVAIIALAAPWFLIGALFESKISLVLYIVLGVLCLIPFFLPAKCYQFSVYYASKWLGWFGRWRTLLLLVVICICSYFAGYSVKWREQYILDNAKAFVIEKIDLVTNWVDDVDYISTTGGDAFIMQVNGKIGKESLLLKLKSANDNESMSLNVSYDGAHYRNYKQGDTVYVFNEQIVHPY